MSAKVNESVLDRRSSNSRCSNAGNAVSASGERIRFVQQVSAAGECSGFDDGGELW